MAELSNIDPSEAALAHIGINNIILDDVPKIGLERLREIQNIDKDIAKRAKALIDGEVSQVKVATQLSYNKLLDALTKGATPQILTDLAAKFPQDQSELVGPLLLKVKDVYDHLKQIFPISEYITFQGPENQDPPDTKVFDFKNKLIVINDPLLVFDLMSTGALLRSQAQTVKLFFPTLSSAITKAFYQADVKAKSAKTSYRLPAGAATGAANWLDRRTVDFQPNKPPIANPMAPKPKAHIHSLAQLKQTPTQEVSSQA